MTPQKSFILLSIFLTVAGCVKPKYPSNNISKIELARLGAWSDPGAAISIDSALNFKYYGLFTSNKREYYEGRIDGDFWNMLNQRLEKIGYKKTKTTDTRDISDANEYELLVYWKGHQKRIVRTASGEPDSVMQFMKWLDSSYKTVKLKKTEPVTFNTTYQTPPVVKGIKKATFYPPKNSEK